MKKVFLFFVCVLIVSAQSFAQKIQVRVASLAPQSTEWGRTLDRIAKEWQAATGGQVELIVYHNGMLGSDEGEVLKKLRTNQIQAAVFTSIGMNGITKKVLTLSVPFLVRSDAEMDYLIEKLGGDLEAAIAESGFQLVNWSRIGWIRFFSRRPVSVPSDLKPQTIGGGGDTQELQNLFKSLGYNIIPIANNDMITALSTSKVDAFYLIPAYAAVSQVFGIAKNMMPLDISPVMGGIVINQPTWRRIPEKYRSKLIEIARKAAKETDANAQKLNSGAIDTMKRNGLVVSSLNQAQEKIWYDEMEHAVSKTISEKNSAFDADIYRRASALLREYRAGRR